MKQEEKELLLKYICASLLNGIKFKINTNIYSITGITLIVTDEGNWEYAVTTKETKPIEIQYVKPYLRPMSSMTEEEWEELKYIGHIVPLYDGCFGVDMRAYCKNSQPHYRRFSEFSTIEDWLNKNHFDYRGLIPMGLALIAPEGMYDLNKQ